MQNALAMDYRYYDDLLLLNPIDYAIAVNQKFPDVLTIKLLDCPARLGKLVQSLC